MKGSVAALVGVYCLIPFAWADSSPPAVAPGLVEIEDLLTKAGATPAEVAFEKEEFRDESAEDLRGELEYFRGLSSAALGHFIDGLQYDLQYAAGPISKRQPGVPVGTTFEFTLSESKIFPGTTHKITVYVPAEYTGEKPACVYVGLDELLFAAPTVFDNLIYKHDMPVTIGIGIAPGLVDSARSEKDPRFNRSAEFDGQSDALARFILEEVFPAVIQHKTSVGIAIRLSEDPNDRAAGGGSTGGIGAFTLAWEAPQAFRRVFTSSGTFVGMRGGDRYGVLIRKTEPKPIRIYMQDGSHEGLDGSQGEIGDWWMENQIVARALEFAGYHVQHVWGEGAHGSRQAILLFPDAMRWLWSGWPSPVVAGTSANTVLQAILEPGEGWREVSGDPAADRALAPARASDGREYVTDTAGGRVWLERRGHRTLLDSGLEAPTGVALSPDGAWLAVAESKGHFGYSYRVRTDGTVDAKQQFYWFHVPDSAEGSGAGGWVFDREGRLYAATRMGVQVFDRSGRSRAILPLPEGVAAVSIEFGGAQRDVLYAGTADHRVFARKFKVPGAPADGSLLVLPPAEPW